MKLARPHTIAYLMSLALGACATPRPPVFEAPPDAPPVTEARSIVEQPYAPRSRLVLDSPQVQEAYERRLEADKAFSRGELDRASELAIQCFYLLESDPRQDNPGLRKSIYVTIGRYTDHMKHGEIAAQAQRRVVALRGVPESYELARAQPAAMSEVAVGEAAANVSGEAKAPASQAVESGAEKPAAQAESGPDSKTQDLEDQRPDPAKHKFGDPEPKFETVAMRIAWKEQVIEDMAKARPAGDPDVLNERLLFARFLLAEGRLKEAREQYAKAFADLAAWLARPRAPGDEETTRKMRFGLAALAEDLGDSESSEEIYGDAADDAAANQPAGSDDWIAATEGQALANERLRRFQRCWELRLLVIKAYRDKLPPGDPKIRAAEGALASVLGPWQSEIDALTSKGEVDAANKQQAAVIDAAEQLPPSNLERWRILVHKAGALQGECEPLKEALALRREILKALRESPQASAEDREDALRELAALLRVLGHASEALPLERELSTLRPRD